MLVLGQLGVIAALGLAGALIFRRGFNLRWFLGALLLYVLYDFLLTRGFFLIPDPLRGANWSWTGKVLAIAGTLAIAALPMFGYARSGITLKHKPPLLTPLIVFVALLPFYIFLSLQGADGKPDDLETIAFQWTMPGLDEEAFYRGILLLAMNQAFRSGLNVFGATITWGGILTSALFGLAHAMDYGKQGYSLDMITFLLTGGTSLPILWIRERTGSILLPIIGHNISNGVSTLF